VDKVARNNIWLTPEAALAPVRRYETIGLDPCTQPSNPVGALHFFTAADNGLERPWSGHGLVYVNPPYSLTAKEKRLKLEPPIRPWSRKIHAEAACGVPIVALLPCGARFSTEYWQDNILVPELVVACFWRGRIKFINGRTGKPGKGNNYDSMFYGFNVDVERFAWAFAPHGAVFAMKHATGRFPF
jgi:phage N-6-adenine-methyltransferase